MIAGVVGGVFSDDIVLQHSATPWMEWSRVGVGVE